MHLTTFTAHLPHSCFALAALAALAALPTLAALTALAAQTELTVASERASSRPGTPCHSTTLR